MSLTRRDFIKAFGVGVAALFLSRCKGEGFPSIPGTGKHDMTPLSCYTPVPPALPDEPTPISESLPPRLRLRICWQSFDTLAYQTAQDVQAGNPKNLFGQRLIDGHRRALDALVASGELTAPVADLVQEAFEAAVYHVWRSSIPVTCYDIGGLLYGPESAAVLVEQARVLGELPGQEDLRSDTLARARLAIQHDMAFYALSEADLQAVYSSLTQDGQSHPPFQEIDLEITPDARAAAQFIVDLLTNP
jgi:hypothetical protein